MTNEATTPEATTDAASPLQPIVRRDHQMTPEDLMHDLRSRISFAHANTIGTESWERKCSADAIESLLDDKSRLDFLESVSIDTEKRAVLFIAPYDGDRPPTLREAIDKAMLFHSA